MLKLFGALVVIQLLSLGYSLGFLFLADEQITFGVLVVVVGSLLGGWRFGLGLSIVTMFIRGTQNLLLDPEAEIFLLYRTRNLRGFFDLTLWGDIFLWRYLVDSEVSSALWAGVVAGLCADLLEERRLMPMVALGLQAGIGLGVGYLTAISWKDPADLIYYLIPSVVVSGLAVAAIALMVRSVQAKAAELARTRAELRALRAQINPHFLFNALNTIRYFVRTEPESARRLLLHLSEVFQRALRSGDFVSLRDELGYVKSYLALEKARLDERLQVEWDARVEDHLDQLVPTLILQPIVENAVVHGIATKSEGGTVHITIELANGDLVLQVEDDGPGIPPDRLVKIQSPAEAGDTAMGLRNVDGRLRALYGEMYRLVVESEIGRGTRVQIRIPIER
jgi:signal transduction histidine kinase